MGGNLTAWPTISTAARATTPRRPQRHDYSGGLTFTATTMVNVENLGLVAGHSYDLVMDNATVTSGNTLRVQAGNFGAGDTVTFDASNDTTGGDYLINTGAGNDVLTGGAGNDRFHPGSGNDTINGNGGDDKIGMNAFLTATDQIDGGEGHDSVVLKGDYSAGVVFTDTTMVNVELIGLVKGDSYSLTMAADTVALGDTLTVRAQSLGVGDNVTFDGSADVAGGAFIINTGDGNDVLTGGNGNDVFRPGAGNDIVHGGGGDDVINMANNLQRRGPARRRQWLQRPPARRSLWQPADPQLQHHRQHPGDRFRRGPRLQPHLQRAGRGQRRQPDVQGPEAWARQRQPHPRWLWRSAQASR